MLVARAEIISPLVPASLLVADVVIITRLAIRLRIDVGIARLIALVWLSLLPARFGTGPPRCVLLATGFPLCHHSISWDCISV